MKRRTNKKKKIITIFLIVLVVVTVGYAVVVSQLKLIGYTTLIKNTWKVYFDNAQLNEGSVTNNEPVIEEDQGDPEKTKVTFTTTLSSPGDYYEFTVDIVNESSVDAMITGKTITSTPTLPAYIKYMVTYDDGVELENNHILEKAIDDSTPTIETIKVRVEFDGEALTNEMLEDMQDNINYNFSFMLTYQKATSQARKRSYHIATCPGCVFKFSTDSYYYSDVNSSGSTQERTVLEDYTDDYKSIRREYYTNPDGYTYDYDCSDGEDYICTRHEEQRKVFLGYILDDNDVIQRGFVCLIKDNKPICLEGVVHKYNAKKNVEFFNKNRNLIHDLWGNNWDSDCSEDDSVDYYHVSCSSTNSEDSTYIGAENESGRYGYWSASSDNGSCYVNNDGYMSCNES